MTNYSQQLTPSAAMMLTNHPKVIQLANDGILASDAQGPYIFQGNNDDKPFKNVAGTGMCSIVVSAWNYNSSSDWSTAKFPRLKVLVYADESRGVDNDVTAHDAQSKALNVYEVLDSILHDVANINHDWFGLQILSSSRDVGPYINPVENYPGLYVLQTYYKVKIP